MTELSTENIFYPALVSLIGALQLGKESIILIYDRVLYVHIYIS